MDIVRGATGFDDNHKPYLFIVDLIKGQNLARKKFTRDERPKAHEVLSHFLISLIDYTQDKYVYGGTYPSDQLYAQYVYGKAPNDLEDKVYFVDLDLQFNSYDPNNLDPKSCNNEVFFNLLLPFAGGFITYLEMKLGNEPLIEARTRYLEFLDSITESSHLHPSEIEHFKEAVQGKKPWRE